LEAANPQRSRLSSVLVETLSGLLDAWHESLGVNAISLQLLSFVQVAPIQPFPCLSVPQQVLIKKLMFKALLNILDAMSFDCDRFG